MGTAHAPPLRKECHEFFQRIAVSNCGALWLHPPAAADGSGAGGLLGHGPAADCHRRVFLDGPPGKEDVTQPDAAAGKPACAAVLQRRFHVF